MTLRKAPSRATCEHGAAINMDCDKCLDDAKEGIRRLMRDNEARYIKTDMVNHPPHYKSGGIETIDYIQAKLTDEEFSGFCKGNALKYISRAGRKGKAAEDYKKAVWYLNRLIDNQEK